MPTSGRHNDPRDFPRLPVLGWSSFSGDYSAPLPGVLNARHRRYMISGRATIVLALRVLGVEAGDKVLRSGKAALPDDGFVATASRLHHTRELADLLDRIGVCA